MAELLLKRKLLDRGMRQRDLARKIGKTDKFISLVACERKIPDSVDRKAIAQILRCTPASLWPNV